MPEFDMPRYSERAPVGRQFGPTPLIVSAVCV